MVVTSTRFSFNIRSCGHMLHERDLGFAFKLQSQTAKKIAGKRITYCRFTVALNVTNSNHCAIGCLNKYRGKKVLKVGTLVFYIPTTGRLSDPAQKQIPNDRNDGKNTSRSFFKRLLNSQSKDSQT